mmetsp:Transcript_46858/g.74594  ORF Transcript_46858/g.74594 Transcript_46858/m.74594 type:complete len:250 (+) Transcript_46858:1874-2623(+)
MQQGLDSWEPIAKATVQVVGQVHPHQHPSGGWVDRHVVGGVIQELGPAVSLNIVGIVVTPAQLHIDPVLGGGRSIETILGLGEQRWLGHGPLVGSEEQHIRAAGVHLVTLARVNRFLLHHLNLQRIQFQIKDLTQIHDDTLMDLLPQVGAEDLDQRDLQGGNLAMHKDSGQIQLHLEAHVDVGSVDGGRPPKREASIGDLIQTAALGVGELLESHGFFKATGLLPEETLPGREVGALEQGVLQDALNTS